MAVHLYHSIAGHSPFFGAVRPGQEITHDTSGPLSDEAKRAYAEGSRNLWIVEDPEPGSPAPDPEEAPQDVTLDTHTEE